MVQALTLCPTRVLNLSSCTTLACYTACSPAAVSLQSSGAGLHNVRLPPQLRPFQIRHNPPASPFPLRALAIAAGNMRMPLFLLALALLIYTSKTSEVITSGTLLPTSTSTHGLHGAQHNEEATVGTVVNITASVLAIAASCAQIVHAALEIAVCLRVDKGPVSFQGASIIICAYYCQARRNESRETRRYPVAECRTARAISMFAVAW